MGALGYFGGTFDPIHYGHLSVAEQVIDLLALTSLHFLPAGEPWQRQPHASRQDRLAMVKLAVLGNSHFNVDDREINRQGPTYTVDSLTEIRSEVGETRPLWLIIGADAFLNITSWHKWQKLLELTHIAVVCRPHYDLIKSTLPDLLQSMLNQHLETHPKNVNSACGAISILEIKESTVSSTEVRGCIQQHRDINTLVPTAVSDYIRSHHLYQ